MNQQQGKPTLTELLIEKITELNRQGTSFLIIEHNMDFIMKRCDPVIAMAEGKVIFEGTPAEAQAIPFCWKPTWSYNK